MVSSKQVSSTLVLPQTLLEPMEEALCWGLNFPQLFPQKSCRILYRMKAYITKGFNTQYMSYLSSFSCSNENYHFWPKNDGEKVQNFFFQIRQCGKKVIEIVIYGKIFLFYEVREDNFLHGRIQKTFFLDHFSSVQTKNDNFSYKFHFDHVNDS